MRATVASQSVTDALIRTVQPRVGRERIARLHRVHVDEGLCGSRCGQPLSVCERRARAHDETCVQPCQRICVRVRA
eukprot:6204037-Pleurochrysis_carterae.AAC.2